MHIIKQYGCRNVPGKYLHSFTNFFSKTFFGSWLIWSHSKSHFVRYVEFHSSREQLLSHCFFSSGTECCYLLDYGLSDPFAHYICIFIIPHYSCLKSNFICHPLYFVITSPWAFFRSLISSQGLNFTLKKFKNLVLGLIATKGLSLAALIKILSWALVSHMTFVIQSLRLPFFRDYVNQPPVNIMMWQYSWTNVNC